MAISLATASLTASPGTRSRRKKLFPQTVQIFFSFFLFILNLEVGNGQARPACHLGRSRGLLITSLSSFCRIGQSLDNLLPGSQHQLLLQPCPGQFRQNCNYLPMTKQYKIAAHTCQRKTQTDRKFENQAGANDKQEGFFRKQRRGNMKRDKKKPVLAGNPDLNPSFFGLRSRDQVNSLNLLSKLPNNNDYFAIKAHFRDQNRHRPS